LLKWALMLAAGLLVFPLVGNWSTSVATRQGVDTIVEGARPVAKAMALISSQLGWNITHEEPVYVNDHVSWRSESVGVLGDSVRDLSAVGPTKVVNATRPRGPVVHTMLPAQERTARARTLLVEALSKTQVPLKWTLMYDPSSATYYLSIAPPGAF
jgi:hypothetical protein